MMFDLIRYFNSRWKWLGTSGFVSDKGQKQVQKVMGVTKQFIVVYLQLAIFLRK